MASACSPRQGPRCSHRGVRRGQHQCLVSAWLSHHNTWELGPSPDHAWLILPLWTLLVSTGTLGLRSTLLQLHCLQTTCPGSDSLVSASCWLALASDQATTACKTADNGKVFCPVRVWISNVPPFLSTGRSAEGGRLWWPSWPSGSRKGTLIAATTALHLRSNSQLTHTVSVVVFPKRRVHFYKLTTLQFACEKGRLQSTHCNCQLANCNGTLLWFYSMWIGLFV